MGDDERNAAILLELSASDDLQGFKHAVEYEGFDVDQVGLWYRRGIGSRKMGFEEMTPFLISSLYGSFRVLNYILKTGKIDVNRPSGSEKATALHFAAASGLDSSAEVVELLINAYADINAGDINGNRPVDLISPRLKNSNQLKRRKLEILLRGESVGVGEEEEENEANNCYNSSSVVQQSGEKKDYAIDVPLPDINHGIYSSDEFRMYSFKVKPCSRAYTHDWTECPFVHPGENARRRDPTKFQYSCVPCPEFRKGSCGKADNCEYAHGVFESWLHPAQYRTRLCKDETGCSRRVCFFAHKREELRPLYASTGSALPSPKTDMTRPMSPSWTTNKEANLTALQLPSSRLKAAVNARDLQLELETMRLENQRQQRQIIDELLGLTSSSPFRIGELKPANPEPVFGLSSSSSSSQMNSPVTHHRSSIIGSSASASPVRKPSSPYGFNPRLSSPAPGFGEWGSPDGKLEWKFNKKEDETTYLKKSISFGYRNGINRTTMAPSTMNEPGGLSWPFSTLEQEKIYA